MKNMILSVIILTALISALFSFKAFGAEKIQAPGGTVTDYESLAAALGGEKSVVLKSDRIVVVKDVVLASPVVITQGSYTIVGEGAGISAEFKEGDFFVLDGEGVVLTLGDPADVSADGSDTDLVGDRDLIFVGGSSSRDGSFVRVGEKAKLQMYISVEMKDAVTVSSGGAVYNCGEFEMYGGLIKNCLASNEGGAVYNECDAVFAKGRIESCSANNGGGIYSSGELHMVGTAVKSCMSGAGSGGAIYNSGILEFKSSEISGCNASKGAAIYNDGTALIQGGLISSNTAGNGLGGGIYNASQLEISSAAVRENKAQKGGNVYNAGTVRLIEGTVVFGGEAEECGGNLYNCVDGLLNFEKGSVSGGKALYGGGIFNEGTLHHSGGGIYKNRADVGEGVLNHGVYLLDGTGYIEKDDDIFVVKDENNSHSVKVSKNWNNDLGIIYISAGLCDGKSYLHDLEIGDKLLSLEGGTKVSENFALFGSPKKLILNSDGEVVKAPAVKLEIILWILGAVIAFALTVTAMVFSIRYFDKKKAVG